MVLKLYGFYGSSQHNGQHMTSKLLKQHFSWKQNCWNRWGFFLFYLCHSVGVSQVDVFKLISKSVEN